MRTPPTTWPTRAGRARRRRGRRPGRRLGRRRGDPPAVPRGPAVRLRRPGPRPSPPCWAARRARASRFAAGGAPGERRDRRAATSAGGAESGHLDDHPGTAAGPIRDAGETDVSARLAVVLVVVAALVAGALIVLAAGRRPDVHGRRPRAGRAGAPAGAGPGGSSTTSVEGLFEVGFAQPRYPDRPADHTGGLDEHWYLHRHGPAQRRHRHLRLRPAERGPGAGPGERPRGEGADGDGHGHPGEQQRPRSRARSRR